MGLDDNSKGARVFWPTKHTITVERNIYFDKSAATDRLKGEDYVTIKTPAASKASSTSNSYPITVAPEITETSVSNDAPTPQQPLPQVQTPEPEVDPQPAPCESRTRRPSKRVQDILTGIVRTVEVILHSLPAFKLCRYHPLLRDLSLRGRVYLSK